MIVCVYGESHTDCVLLTTVTSPPLCMECSRSYIMSLLFWNMNGRGDINDSMETIINCERLDYKVESASLEYIHITCNVCCKT